MKLSENSFLHDASTDKGFVLSVKPMKNLTFPGL